MPNLLDKLAWALWSLEFDDPFPKRGTTMFDYAMWKARTALLVLKDYENDHGPDGLVKEIDRLVAAEKPFRGSLRRISPDLQP